MRVASAVLVALMLAVSLAEAQRGWRGGRGGWGGEVGAPPKFPNVSDFDGSWHFCRLMYRSVRSQQRGLGWGTDYPYADINFSTRLSELTKTQVGMQDGEPNHLVVRPTDPELFQCPFVMASDPGSAGFSPEDAAGLRDYLLKGGFLWVDDFWGRGPGTRLPTRSARRCRPVNFRSRSSAPIIRSTARCLRSRKSHKCRRCSSGA